MLHALVCEVVRGSDPVEVVSNGAAETWHQAVQPGFALGQRQVRGDSEESLQHQGCEVAELHVICRSGPACASQTRQVPGSAFTFQPVPVC